METYGPTLSFKNRKALLMAIAPSAPPKNLEPVSPWLPPLPEKSRASAPELSSFLSLGWDPWRRRGSCSPHLDPAPIDPSLVGWDLLGNDRSDNRPLPALTWPAARTSGSRGRVAARFGRPRLGPRGRRHQVGDVPERHPPRRPRPGRALLHPAAPDAVPAPPGPGRGRRSGVLLVSSGAGGGHRGARVTGALGIGGGGGAERLELELDVGGERPWVFESCRRGGRI